MAYTITDLIDKFILIEQNGYEMFVRIAADEGADERIKSLARVFANEERRHEERYKKLRDDIAREPDIEVDFRVYDRVTKFIYEFINSSRAIANNDIKAMLEFCLDYEKENLALVMSIQGVFADEKNGAETKAYSVLAEIINEEEKHAKNIEMFLK